MKINAPRVVAYGVPTAGQIPLGPPIPEPSGEIPGHGISSGGNGSGTGSSARLPPELRGFNWGALLTNWIWAIAHNTWIGLLCIIPYAGTVMAIVLGFKGNQWAWQNRRWESVEQFRNVQRIWRNWGLCLVLIPITLAIVAAILFPVFAKARFNARRAAQASVMLQRPG